jgi:hypothetical protein
MTSYGTGQRPEQQDAPPAWAQELFGRLYTDMRAQSERMRLLEQQIEERIGTNATTMDATPVSTSNPSQATTTSAEVETQPLQVVRRKDQLPHPPEFSGKRSEFRSWLTQIRAKLFVDKSDEAEAVRFWYVHSRLRGDALLQVDSWVCTVQTTGAMSVEGLISQLQAAYADNESAERAARKLNMMRQGSKPFSTFLAEFDRTILDAGGLDWSDQVKKTFLSNGLSAELQTALVATPTPELYRDYCTLLHTVSANLEAVRKRRQRDGGYTLSKASTVETLVAEDTMEWESTPAVTAAAVRIQRAQWVPKEIMDKRRAEGRCLRCGKDGHFVRDCPLLPAEKGKKRHNDPQGSMVSTVSSKETTEPIEDSGKD